VWQKFTDVSEKRTILVFRIEEYVRQVTKYSNHLSASLMFWLLFNPEDGSSNFLRNIGELPDYTMMVIFIGTFVKTSNSS
jgi:hypothetical protein